MRTIISFGWGTLLIVLGVGLLVWIGYNLFVEMQPAAEGRSPVVPTLFALALVAAGVFRLRTQLRGTDHRGRDDVA